MSYGGQPNTPWQRGNINVPQQSDMNSFGHQSGGNFSSGGNISYPQQNMSSFGPQGGNNMYPSNVVAYPQQRNNMNAAAFQQGPIGNIPQPQFNAMGSITKINSECGLINDEVFFYRNICKGGNVKLGDRVVFDATFSTTGQFKWNANRVQVMPQPPSLMSGVINNGSGYSAVPPPNDYVRPQQAPRRSSPVRDHHALKERVRHRSRDRDDEHERKRRRDESDRSRERVSAVSRHATNHSISRDKEREDRRREHSLDRKDREKEREREKERDRERERERADRIDRSDRTVVKGRRNRAAIRRYIVKIPTSLISFKNVDIQELRERFNTLYIPSDFFYANVKWPQLFKPEDPFPLNRPSQFHIMHKMVEPLEEQKPEILEPEDANYLYSAKVMLLACPSISEIYQKCFEDESSDSDFPPTHPLRLISFLVGTCGRNEPMAIGGPWSPSLDGENPDKDPSVLIRTAIRTCKALTGIDLSKCTQWYRFLELHYHRADYKNREKDGPPRVETVVIYVPDVHSCMPNQLEWGKLNLSYKAALDEIIQRKSAIAKSTGADAAVDGKKNGKGGEQMEVVTIDISETESNNGAASGVSKEASAAEATQNDDDDEEEEEEEGGPTHHSKLEVKSMKLQEIKDELAARDLPNKGSRNILVARLTKALSNEKEEEEKAKKIEEAAKTPAKPVANKEVAKTPNNMKIPKKQSESAKKIEAKEKTPNKKAKVEEKQTNDNENVEDQEDIDMSDIVILDEYDSLNPEDVKEFDEKEKNQLTRRYSLPKAPHIVVHPNRLAKAGKFDCSVMSLSVLLDYRLGDTKERFFEVSLFAEIFNEMLTRDFGFNIYKELYFCKETNESDHSDSKEEDEKKVKKEENGKDNKDDKKTSSETKTDNDETSSKSASEKKRQANASNSKDKDKDKNKDKDDKSNKKMVVVKPYLLLSFVFFDTSHCGYIFEKDLEQLFLIIGLNLSRGQIRTMLGKLTTRLAFYYRKITDKEESVEAPPAIEDLSNELPEEDVKKIALGNRQYSFVFDGAQKSLEVASSNENSDLINYNGAVVHVGRLMEQIKRTENSYADLETLYNDLRKQHSDLQRDSSKATSKAKDLQSEVKSLSRKLSAADQDAFSLNRKYKDQQATLSYIYNRVSAYFTRDKDKDHKSESSRDKTKNEKEKEKEKDKNHVTEKDAKGKDAKEVKDKTSKEKENKEAESKDKKVEKEKPKIVNKKNEAKSNQDSEKEKTKNAEDKKEEEAEEELEGEETEEYEGGEDEDEEEYFGEEEDEVEVEVINIDEDENSQETA